MATEARAPSLKDRQRQERQDLILRVAGDLLAERGYNEVSLDEIAARVGISKGTIYLHFASKEDLVVALLEAGVETFARWLDETLRGPGAPREKLERVIERMSAETVNNPIATVMETTARQPELMARLAERRHEMRLLWEEPRRRLSEVIEAGKASGEFDPTLPTPLVLSVFMTLLSPHTSRRLVEREGMSQAEVVADLSRFFFKGLARPGTGCDTGAPPTGA